MKIKTRKLTDAALDWAVSLITNPDWEHEDRLVNVQCLDEDSYSPQDCWAQGGPIIERENIGVGPGGCARKWNADSQEFDQYIGPTPLIAAMRCYVASKLGDQVEIPEELV